jgi:hypothetical protein
MQAYSVVVVENRSQEAACKRLVKVVKAAANCPTTAFLYNEVWLIADC